MNKDTLVKDLLAQYPWLKDEAIKINEKFKLLNSPIAKVMLQKATIADMAKKTGLEVDIIISKINELIEQHK